MENIIEAKIKSLTELSKILGNFPRVKKVVMCHGTFDVVHPGHIRHLSYAKQQGTTLVVSLTCDRHISKSALRPYIPEDLRAFNLAALQMVDYVIIDQNTTPLDNIRMLQPDFFAKGYEYSADSLPKKTADEKEVITSYGGEFLFTPGDVVFSSSKIIESGAPDIRYEKLRSLMIAEGVTFTDLKATLTKLQDLSVHVVGDTIIDSYTRTSMIGGQNKTPTISVKFIEKESFVGGAGIVAKHLKSAGATVFFSTILSDDELGFFAKKDLESHGVEINAIIEKTRPTTEKNAIVCENYRLLKIDTLDNSLIGEPALNAIKDSIKNTHADCLVFSDFRHGIFNRESIPDLTASIPEGVFKVADSQVASRWGNILEFQNFDLITPNEREARFALGDQDSVIRPLATRLFLAANCSNLILKLGSKGCMGYRKQKSNDEFPEFFVLDSFADHIVDPVGSGDALLAYATLAERATGSQIIAAILGAIAAGCECELDGNIPISASAIEKKISEYEKRTF